MALKALQRFENWNNEIAGTSSKTLNPIGQYRYNARAGRAAQRKGNQQILDANKAGWDKIDQWYAEEQARQAAAEKANQEALAPQRAIGDMGAADLAAFRADPVAFIKQNTDYSKVLGETVAANDASASARGDFLGSGHSVRTARDAVSLMGTKRQEALGNIMALLQIGGRATEQGIAARESATASGAQLTRDRTAAQIGESNSLSDYYRNIAAINAGRYADANAITMDLVKTGAGLGIAGATLAAGVPPAP